jgi:CDP-glucose 4,6-dehydratase
VSVPESAGETAHARVDPAFWHERRVLLTGHTGFKGAWLALWLRLLGARVVGFSAGVPTSPSLYELARVGDQLESVDGDVRDCEALSRTLTRVRPQLVIHMAAQSLVRRSLRAPLETYEMNVLGTANVLEAVRRAGPDVRAVLVVTSDKCYEDDGSQAAHREDDPLGGADPYSSSKACAELVTAAFRRSFFAANDRPRVATARAGNVIGGGDWACDRLLPDIMRAALAGERLLIRNPHAVRPWQHVLNPLSGYLLLAQALSQTAEAACAWNFGPAQGDARPVSYIVERVCELWGDGLAWEVDERAHPAEAGYLQLDSSRARERLGWRAPLGLEEGLAATVAWYRELHAAGDVRALTIAQIEAAQGA